MFVCFAKTAAVVISVAQLMNVVKYVGYEGVHAAAHTDIHRDPLACVLLLL